MDESEFLETVRERATLESTDKAQETTIAVLKALGGWNPEGNARTIALDLPPTVAEYLTNSRIS